MAPTMMFSSAATSASTHASRREAPRAAPGPRVPQDLEALAAAAEQLREFMLIGKVDIALFAIQLAAGLVLSRVVPLPLLTRGPTAKRGLAKTLVVARRVARWTAVDLATRGPIEHAEDWWDVQADKIGDAITGKVKEVLSALPGLVNEAVGNVRRVIGRPGRAPRGVRLAASAAPTEESNVRSIQRVRRRHPGLPVVVPSGSCGGANNRSDRSVMPTTKNAMPTSRTVAVLRF